jgi:histidinol-phosphate aminotransferase
MEPIRAVREPFAVNRTAHAGALAALDDEEYKHNVIEENRREMVKLTQELQSFGFKVTESHANFLFVDLKEDVTEIANALMREGILIRPCTAWGLTSHARITIGTAKQNKRLISALKKIGKMVTSI